MLKKGSFDFTARLPYVIIAIIFIGMLFGWSAKAYAEFRVDVSEEESKLIDEIYFSQIINCISDEGVLKKDVFEKGKLKQEVIEKCFTKNRNFQLKLETNQIAYNKEVIKDYFEYTRPIGVPYRIGNTRIGIAPLKLILEKRGEYELVL